MPQSHCVIGSVLPLQIDSANYTNVYLNFPAGSSVSHIGMKSGVSRSSSSIQPPHHCLSLERFVNVASTFLFTSINLHPMNWNPNNQECIKLFSMTGSLNRFGFYFRLLLFGSNGSMTGDYLLFTCQPVELVQWIFYVA